MEGREAFALAERIGRRLMDEGAQAVVLAGSVVRGDPTTESDIDLYAVGPRFSNSLERHRGRLISITWQTPAAEAEAFRSPSKAGAVIPAWRNARILLDPNGVAAGLQQEAREWTWDAIARERLDRYVADEVTGLAEEVHKLIAALRTENYWTAAVQRNILALHLAPILSVQLRLLYETENRLWSMVADAMGPEWRDAQREAFETPLAPSCRAALRLYALAAHTVSDILDPREREVVTYATSLIQ